MFHLMPPKRETVYRSLIGSLITYGWADKISISVGDTRCARGVVGGADRVCLLPKGRQIGSREVS